MVTAARPSQYWATPILQEFTWFTKAARAPVIRPLRQFAEEEIILGEGKHRNERFRCDTLPWTGLLFDEIDRDRWRRVIVRGVVQGGKTLCGFVIPCLWHLFEWREPFICGVPTMDMAFDKWRKEFLPTIKATPKFKQFLPTSGRGSKGGEFEAIALLNGAELKFMPGHGGDEKRSGYTGRVAGITEADRLDEAGETSREAAPVHQIEARLASYGAQFRWYAECTTTTETGYVWVECKEGTDSRIMGPCEHCETYVTPSREHLVGYHDAESKQQAFDLSHFVCPACNHEITPEQRVAMNLASKLVHRGQIIHSDGTIEGDEPATDTLGFVFNGFNNLFWEPGFIGENEWRCLHSTDFADQDKKMRQWYWALPAEPDTEDLVPLTTDDVVGRASTEETMIRGKCPEDTTYASCGIDLRARQLHFAVGAFNASGNPHVADFGIIPVQSREFGIRKALLLALHALHERLSAGLETPSGRKVPIGWRIIDSNWKGSVVHTFVREMKRNGVKAYLPSMGRGMSQPVNRGGYHHPSKPTKEKPRIGEQYYVKWEEKPQLYVLYFNSDHWKTNIHESFSTPPDEPGGASMFVPITTPEKVEQRLYSQHLVSEKSKLKIVAERGPQIIWFNETGRQNHFLDCTSLMFIGAHNGGVRILEEKRARRRARVVSSPN